MKTGLCRGIVLLVVRLAGVWGGELYLNLDPPVLSQVPNGVTTQINISLSFNDNVTAADEGTSEDRSDIFQLMLTADPAWRTLLEPSSFNFTREDVQQATNKTIQVTGQFMGHATILMKLVSWNASEYPDDGELVWFQTNTNSSALQASFIRSSTTKDVAFFIIIMLLVVCMNFNMGMQLDFETIKQVLKKPVGPFTGFLAQFLLMPLIAYLLARFGFPDQPLYQLGLFTLGCSPGGGNSNFWTIMFDADVNLSVTMTFVSTLAALGMMPLWMFTLGQTFTFNDRAIQIPFSGIFISLLTMAVPSVLGMLIRWRRPQWKKYSDKTIRPMIMVVLVFFLTVGIWLNLEQFSLLTGHQFLVGFGVIVLGFSMGAVLALLFCRPRQQVIAISIETALQNGGIALILLKMSLPAPDGEIAGLAAIAQLFMQGPVLWGGFFVYKMHQLVTARMKRTRSEVPADPKEVEKMVNNEEAS